MTQPNFWNSFEVKCISMDFKYDSYLELHNRAKQKHKPLSQEGYQGLKDVFNLEYERDQVK